MKGGALTFKFPKRSGVRNELLTGMCLLRVTIVTHLGHGSRFFIGLSSTGSSMQDGKLVNAFIEMLPREKKKKKQL